MMRRAKHRFRKGLARPVVIDRSGLSRPAFKGEREFVFVAGCSRSGTTALTQLLNRHPDVAIGYERFREIGWRGELNPALFEPERFRDFRPEDGRPSFVGDPMREPVLHKIHAARVVGDKIPQLVENLEQLDRFREAKVIFIIRDPFSIALSFNVRAENDRDVPWEPERNYVAAVREFNDSLRFLLAYRETGRPWLVVEYNNLFIHGHGADDVWKFVGVDPKAAAPVDDILNAGRANKDRLMRSLTGQEIALNADYSNYRAAHNLAMQHLTSQQESRAQQ